MRINVVVGAFLLRVAWASPHYHPYGHGGYRHGVVHHSSGYASGSGNPVVDPTDAPYGLGNGTSTLNGTGTAVASSTSSITIQQTSTVTDLFTVTGNDLSATGLPIKSPVPAGSDSNSPIDGSSGPCKGETTTVTYNPTVTVTFTSLPTSFSTSLPSSVVASTPSVEASATGEPTPTTSPPTPTTTARSLLTSKLGSDTASVAAAVPSTSPDQTLEPTTSEDASELSTVPAVVPSSSATVIPAIPSSSTPAAVPTTKPSSGKKRGILASSTDQDLLVTAFNSAQKISWLCNWFSAPPQNVDPRIEFVPQNYGKQSDIAPKFEWTANAKAAVAQGRKHFLSFGEPEFLDNKQLYMDPQEAVDLFMKEMQPYADQVTIGSPGVLQPTTDLEWLSDFLSLCDKAGCKIGFVAVHWFWSATHDHIQWFKDTVDNATTIANGRPVWVDNFQATGTNEAQQDFLAGVLPWLEANDKVERYAYVSPERSTGTGLLNADGSLSSLGEFYANF